jgi:hypothetical protein
MHSQCSGKSSWRAGDAARQVSFQIFSGGSQCAVLLIENQYLVRVGEANLNERHRPVSRGVVNNRILIVAVGALFEFA